MRDPPWVIDILAVGNALRSAPLMTRGGFTVGLIFGRHDNFSIDGMLDQSPDNSSPVAPPGSWRASRCDSPVTSLGRESELRIPSTSDLMRSQSHRELCVGG
jgi:hypothetical protein